MTTATAPAPTPNAQRPTPALQRPTPGLRDPRWPFAALLTLYAVLGCTVLGFNRSWEQIALTVGAACGLDLVLSRLARGRWSLPLSAYISGLSLSLLLSYAHGSPLWLLPVYLAVGSKYVFTWRGRHVFNPSLFGIAVTLLAAGDLVSAAPAYQWGGSLALTLFIGTAALCLFALRIGRTPLILSFLAFYALQTALRAWIMRWHLPPETLFLGTLTSAPFFLFTFYMLTDPRTSPQRPRDQVAVAFAIALIDLLLHKRESLYTLYYAGFTVQATRFTWLHVQDLLTRPRSTAPRPQPLSTSGGCPLGGWPKAGVRPPTLALGFLGLGVFALASPITPQADPNFRLETVPSAHSGINSRLGTTLEEVDPRVRHVAKWILSVGDAVASGDYDGDGRIDLLFTQPLKRPEDRVTLYRNLGDLRFRRVPLPALDPVVRRPADHGLMSGALFVDYDSDGDQDLFLNAGFGQSRLLRSELVERGAPTFTDVTETAGLQGHSVSLAAQFLDMDRDGRLDLFLANAMTPLLPDYSRPTPLNLFRLPQPEYPGDRRMFHFMHASWFNATNGGQNVLYRGLPNGRFQRLDSPAHGMPQTHWSLAAGTGDLNQDGWTDLYVANDFGPDDLYLNRSGRGWQHVRGAGLGSIGRDTYKGMNASLGDLDGDGNLDIYVSNVHAPLQPEGSLVWTSHPDGGFVPRFRERAHEWGALNERRFGWGAALGDLDLDGHPDLLQANGMVDDTPDRRAESCPDYWYVNEKVSRSGPEIHAYADMWGDIRGRCIFGREANRVYLNRGPAARPRFLDVAPQVGWTEKTSSRGIAAVDLDNDGDLDAVVTHPFAPPSVYRNTRSEQPASWLGLSLQGDGRLCSREAIGARVTLAYNGDGRVQRQVREVQLANGFSAQSDRRLLFGLGAHTGPVQVEVAWPDGMRSRYAGLRPGRYHRLIRGHAPGRAGS